MENETIDFIGCLFALVLLIGSIGIGFYALHALLSSKKVEKSNAALVLDGNLKYTPCDKPYKKLWDDSGCCILFDMDGVNRDRLNINGIRGIPYLPLTYNYEDVYHDVLLELIKDGKKYREKENNNPELRKFCIERMNALWPLDNRIKAANVLYEYINNGKLKAKED